MNELVKNPLFIVAFFFGVNFLLSIIVAIGAAIFKIDMNELP